MLGALTDHVGAALEVESGEGVVLAADEDLPERRHGVAGQGAERRVVGRDLTPAEDLQALALDDLLDGVGCALRVGLALRQERDAGGVRAFRGQREVDHGAEELVRDLEEDAGAVTRVGSEPAAPRCSRFTSAVIAFSTMSLLRRPFMSTTNATPQESCSFDG